MPRSRREFLTQSTLAMLGAAALKPGSMPQGQGPGPTAGEPTPGAPPAFGTTPPAGPEVSTATFAEAEKIVQVELKPATIRISRFDILMFDGSEAQFEMSVSAGGYVRSVAHDLGQQLGCGAHLGSLRRTAAGAFTLADAHTLEELEPLADNVEALESNSIHPRKMLPEIPAVTADETALGRLRNGGQANLAEFSQAELVKVFSGQRDLVAIARRLAGTLFQPVVVLG